MNPPWRAMRRKDNHELFTVTEVAIPPAAHQVVLHGSFDGHERAQLAVVSLTAAGTRQIRLLALREGEWHTTHDAALDAGTLFVDTARVAGGRDRLIAYRHASVDWFDFEASRQRPLVSVTTNYRAAADDGIPRLDVARDVNGDGLDDLLIPDVGGFWLALQSRDGSFRAACPAGAARSVCGCDGLWKHAHIPANRHHRREHALVLGPGAWVGLRS